MGTIAVAICLSACDRPAHEPVEVIAPPPAAPPLEPVRAVPAPVVAASQSVLDAPAAVAPKASEPLRRPGFVPADRMPAAAARPAQSGNEGFKRAITERLCRTQPENAQANGTNCPPRSSPN